MARMQWRSRKELCFCLTCCFFSLLVISALHQTQGILLKVLAPCFQCTHSAEPGAGASASKVLLVFKHIGLLCFREGQYYYHQRHIVLPTIVKFWRQYRANIINSLNGKEVVLAGDGRHDSMGHSAKYGCYTMLC